MKPRISHRKPQVGLLVVLLTMVAWATNAQTNYAVDWFTIDGGGGISTSAVFSVTATIGQPDAGEQMSGGDFAVQGGFWGVIVAVVQVPDAPFLNVRLTQTNSVVLSWPSSPSGFELQEISSLSSTNWSNVSFAPQDDGTNRSVTLTLPTGHRYYRLFNPTE